MFQPLEWFIGLRYLRSRRRRGVVSFMSAASFLGIALGVAALIVILSIMNGLETETRTRLLSMSAHATNSSRAGLKDWSDLERRLRGRPGVAAVSPYVTIEGMLAAGMTGERPHLSPLRQQAAGDVLAGKAEGAGDHIEFGHGNLRGAGSRFSGYPLRSSNDPGSETFTTEPQRALREISKNLSSSFTTESTEKIFENHFYF